MGYRRLIPRLGALLLLAVLSLRAAQHLVSHDYNEAFEAICLNASLQFADGQTLYPPQTARPFYVYVHSPLGSLIHGTAAKLFATDQTFARIVVIRLVSLAALFATLAILWVGVLRPAGIEPTSYGLILLLGLAKFADYATTGRNDTLSMLAEIATLAAFLGWQREKRLARLLLFACCAIVSVYTRQMGLMVAGAALLTLLVERDLRSFAIAFCAMVVPAALIFLLIDHQTSGAFFQHLIAYNIRPYAPILARDSILLQPSSLAFFACYALYAVLAGIGYANGKNAPRVLRIGVPLSLVLSSLLYFRPGGDVNYFFEPILLSAYFAARGWEKVRAQRPWRCLVYAQGLLIIGLVGGKMRASHARGTYDYAAAAQAIRAEFPGPGWVVGRQGDGMVVHLRGWSIHGPDVTTGAPVAYYCLPKTNWIFESLRHDFETGALRTVVVAEPGCAERTAAFGFPSEVGDPAGPPLHLVKQFDDTVCVFQR